MLREECRDRLAPPRGIGPQPGERVGREGRETLPTAKMPGGVGHRMRKAVPRHETVGRQRRMAARRRGHETPCFLNQSRHFVQPSLACSSR